MRELEDRLRALRAEVEWPATPDLAAAVAGRIEGAREVPATAAPRARRRFAPRRIAVVVALALLIPAAAAVAFPSARDDVLEWLGLRGAEVRRTTQPPPASAPRENDLGRVVSQPEAERLAGFRLALPPDLGPPRELRHDETTGFVTALFDGGVLVAQARGALSGELVEKIVGPQTGVRAVTVDGARGVYIDGPHSYLYRQPGGVIAEDRPRRAPRALVFNRGDVLVRIEGPPLERALALARSMR